MYLINVGCILLRRVKTRTSFYIDAVLFVGRWQNDNAIDTINLNELEKTQEFGGQTSGKRVNLGIQFEKDFYKSLNCEVECLCEHTKYEDAAKHLVKRINDEYDIKGGLSKV